MRCFHLFLTCILSFAAKESGKINFSFYHVSFISPYQLSFPLDVSLAFILIFYLPLKSEFYSSIVLLFPCIFLISSIFLLPLFVFLVHIVLFFFFIFSLSFSNLCELYYKLSPLGLYTSSFFGSSFSLFWYSFVSFYSFCLFHSFYLSFFLYFLLFILLEIMKEDLYQALQTSHKDWTIQINNIYSFPNSHPIYLIKDI